MTDVNGVNFIMLNPSTADEAVDDATVRRCMAFARDLGCDVSGSWASFSPPPYRLYRYALGRGDLVVTNLYALRSTDPTALWRAPDPVGPENDHRIALAAKRAAVVICAWGVNAKPERVAHVVAILRHIGVTPSCLATSKDGSPRHPLYLSKSLKPYPWTGAGAPPVDSTR